jgi:hypothetical protein
MRACLIRETPDSAPCWYSGNAIWRGSVWVCQRHYLMLTQRHGWMSTQLSRANRHSHPWWNDWRFGADGRTLVLPNLIRHWHGLPTRSTLENA